MASARSSGGRGTRTATSRAAFAPTSAATNEMGLPLLPQRGGFEDLVSTREHASGLERVAVSANGAGRRLGGFRDGQHLNELTCFSIGHRNLSLGSAGFGEPLFNPTATSVSRSTSKIASASAVLETRAIVSTGSGVPENNGTGTVTNSTQAAI
jgi:hypothetical protein